MHVNVGNNRGFLLKRVELEASIRLMEAAPTFVGLTETLLDQGTKDEELQLTGYKLISRRDRCDGRKGGGIAFFVKEECVGSVNVQEYSKDSERAWHLIHTGHGPILLGLWYRPPARGELATVESLQTEWARLSEECVGTIILGDMNVHHETWLKHSSQGNTPEGAALYSFCLENGFKEKVKQPTRGENLLDLVLTDLDRSVVCQVLPKVEDHAAVLATVAFTVPAEYMEQRERWRYEKANWKGLKKAFCETDWAFLDTYTDVDAMQERLVQYILHTARGYIPVGKGSVRKSTHPWMNTRCLELVAAKREAEDTPEYDQKLKECSEGILEEFNKYVGRVRSDLRKLPRSSKKWWKLARGVTMGSQNKGAIPPLKGTDGNWATKPKDKCDLLLKALTEKYKLAGGATNEHTEQEHEAHTPEVSGFFYQ